MQQTCQNCQQKITNLQKECAGCGFTIVLEPEEKTQKKFLRRPSLGALLWTQGWAFGARLYLWFALSLIPIVGIAALIILVIFGRRWSWKRGSWSSWNEFQQRMKLLDRIALAWIILLIIVYYILRLTTS